MNEESKRRLLVLFTDPNKEPFEGAVQMICDGCGRFIVWVNPPLPLNGKTICTQCQNKEKK